MVQVIKRSDGQFEVKGVRFLYEAEAREWAEDLAKDKILGMLIGDEDINDLVANDLPVFDLLPVKIAAVALDQDCFWVQEELKKAYESTY